MTDLPSPPEPGSPPPAPVAGALGIVREHASTLVRVALVGVLPVVVLDAVDYLVSDVDPFTAPADPQGAQTTLSWLVLGVNLALYSLVTAACLRVVADALAGRRPQWRTALAWGAPRTIAVLLVSVLISVGVALGLLALVLPGIFLAVAWSVATPAVALEGSSPFRALGRSFGLVRGSWWHAFGVLLLGLLVGLGAVVAVAIPITLLIAAVEGLVGRVLIYALVEGLLTVLLLPFAAALLTLLYHDLRARQEGSAGGASFRGFQPPAAPDPR